MSHTSHHVRDVSGQQSLKKLFNEDQLIIVDFWASWCPPCVFLKPFLIKEANQKKTFILACVNCDDQNNASLKKKFGVSGIPSVFLLHHHIDNRIHNFVGANKAEFQTMINKTLQLKGKSIAQKKVRKLKNIQWFCDEGHKLVQTAKLTQPYINNAYGCNLCGEGGTASVNQPMLHCDKCQYDVCYECSHDIL